MKKTLLLLASAALLLVGCAKEKFSPEAGDAEMVNMTVSALVQGEELTRAAVDEDGKGVNANRCIMVLYYGDQVYGSYTATVSNYKATFDVKVPAKRTYKAVFWADYATADGEGGFTDVYYNTADLKNITLKSAYVGNNDKRDAFFKCEEYTVENKSQRFTATLTRPFAQINVISKDIEDLHLASLYPQKVNLSFSAATSFNAMSGECGAAETITYEAGIYKAYDPAKEQLTLSMDYLFAGDRSTVDIDFKAPTEGTLKVEHNFSNIPYQRNYRTNIVGNLLTADAHWDVTVDPKWGLSDDQKIDVNLDEVENIEAANLALAAGSNDLEIKLPSDSDDKSIVFTAVNDEQDVILNFTGNLGSANTIKFDNAEGAQGPLTLNVTAPAGTKLVFIDPQNHVVINGTSYVLVQGAFSANTLVISKDVSVNTLKITAGGLEIHGTVNAVEGLTNNVKVRECEGLSENVYNALKNYIDAPQYKAVQKDNTWDIVAADKTAMIGENVYYNLEDALKAAQSGDEIKLLIDLENIDRTSIPTGVTFNGCGHKITGNSSLYISASGGAIKNVVFKDIHNDKSNMSAIYAESLAAKAEISGCTFENIDWDAIQITTNSANADIVIKDNEFKAVAKDTKQQRFIHIQTDKYSNVNLKAAITGNKFSGIYNLQNTAIELYCPTDFNKVNISGNYLDGNKVSVCIANKENGAWANHIESAKNWLDANGQPVAVNAAIRADEDAKAENILLCTTLAVALQESSNWEGSLCILNEAALRELSTLVNGGKTFSGKTVALVNDVDLKNVEWTPIGQLDGSKSFAGIFDGHNNTVSNLTVTGELEQVGFFGYTSSGSVKNLKLKNISLQGSHFIGAVVAYDGNNSGLIENCYVDGGSIVSTPILINGSYDNGDKVGGIAGQLYGGHTIKNCSVKNLSITAYRDLGGIIGHPNGNCTVDGNVVENVILIQSSKNAYKDEVITTIGEIAGRNPQYAEGQNTVINVSIITQPVEGYTFYKNEKRHEISSVAGLKYFRDEVNKGETYAGHTVQLMNSLNLSGETWKPIGGLVSYPSVSFYGVFDGQGYTISNLSCNETLQNYACAGLFGSLMGTVKNVILTDVDIKSTHYAGGICAYSSSSGSKVENCKVIGGTITSTPELIGSAYDNGDKAGGIFGYNGEGGPITGCSVENLTIRAYRDLGGVVGAGRGTISGCTVKNTTIIQDNTNGYKTSIDTYHEILGNDLGATLTDNSYQNVTLKSEN